MSVLFAFLHHLAAFTLVACVTLEFVLLRGEMTLANARRVAVADAALGAAATLLLAAGLLRVFLFERGAAYYFASGPFLVKFALFVALALLSIYPTREFLSWRGALKAGRVPSVEPRKQAAIRRVLHVELTGIVLILLCAALMAKGAGMVG